jgi:hypothetical protein
MAALESIRNKKLSEIRISDSFGAIINKNKTSGSPKVL